MSRQSIKLAASLVLAFSFAAPAPAMAEMITKDDFRARVVDYCLFEQWKRARDGETKGILADCRCAAKAYVKDLEKEKLDELRTSRTLSRSDKREVLKAHATCK